MLPVRPPDHARMGQYLRVYEPRVNAHTVINQLYRLQARSLLVTPAAIVTEKDYPDISYWQGEIIWAKMRAQTDTVVIKEGQNTWTDPMFARNWAMAKDRGMYRGAYRFYDGRVSPGKQAETMVRNLENDLPETEFIMDWEHSYGGPYEGLRNVVACMQEVERLLPGILWKFYTGYYWFVGNSNPITNASHYNYLKTKRLWLAWYASNPDYIKIPPPWTRLDDWQYGTPAEGAAYGVQSVEIDKNYFNGTTEQFYNLYGGNPEPPDPDNGGTVTDKYMKVTDGTTSLNIRTSGENLGNDPVTGNDLGPFNLTRGDIIHVVESKPNNFQRFDRLYRGGVLTPLPASPTGQYWACAQDANGTYLIDTPFTPPPDPQPGTQTIEATVIDQDSAGNTIAIWKGTLTKQ